MLDIYLNITSIAFLIGIAIYAMQLSNLPSNSDVDSLNSLRQIRSGFLSATAFAMLMLLPNENLSLPYSNLIEVGSVIGIGLSLVLALKGLSRWHEITSNRKSVDLEVQSKIDKIEEFAEIDDKSAKGIVLIENCLHWSASNVKVMNTHTLAGSFLRMLVGNLGIDNCLMVRCKPTTVGAGVSIVKLASVGMDQVSQDQLIESYSKLNSKVVESSMIDVESMEFNMVGSSDEDRQFGRILIFYDTDNSESIDVRTLKVCLDVFSGALQRQLVRLSLSKRIFNDELKFGVRENFKSSQLAVLGGEESEAGLRIPHVVFETLSKTLKILSPDEFPCDYLFVELYNEETGVAVSLTQILTQSKDSVRPRTGFYPYARRVKLESDPREVVNLIRAFPIFDSRPERERIMNQGLRSVIHGSLTIDESVEVLIVFGGTTAGCFGESQCKLVSELLIETQALIDIAFVSSTEQIGQSQDSDISLSDVTRRSVIESEDSALKMTPDSSQLRSEISNALNF